MAKSIVLITGASSGIGMEFTLQLDAHLRKTDEIWLIGRDRKKLVQLSKRLRNNTKILSMDLTKEGQIERLSDTLKDEKARIRILVNCAGFGKIGNVAEISKKDQADMIKLNCEAMTSVTMCCLPYVMKNGRIIHMASSAAFIPQPGFAVYAATKSYVDSFSMALRQEVKNRGISVTSVCPGPVDTPFFAVAEESGKRLAIKDRFMVDPYRVVDQALREAVIFKSPRSICSLPIQLLYVASRIIPDVLLVPLIQKMKEEA